MIKDLQKIEELDLGYFKANPNEISFERKPYPGEFTELSRFPNPGTALSDLFSKATWVVVIHISADNVLKIPTIKPIAQHSKGRTKGFRVSR